MQTRAVITGAAKGLGRAFAEALASDGTSLVLGDVDEAGLAETAAALCARGATVETRRTDVRDPGDLVALRELARTAFGGTDLLINNAGVAVGGPLEEVSLEDWRWVLEVNLWGVIHGVRAFVPEMRARGSGRVINVASVAGLVHAPELGPYNVSKAGVVALSETLWAELAGSGVGVTVVCPSFFDTDIMRTARGPMKARSLALAERFMRKARVQAPDVARHALRASERGELHALPMADARLMWRWKRMHPGAFQRSATRLTRSRLVEWLAGK